MLHRDRVLRGEGERLRTRRQKRFCGREVVDFAHGSRGDDTEI